MELLVLMEENDIKWNLITEPILKDSLFGGATNKIPGYSRDTPRPYMPSFLDP